MAQALVRFLAAQYSRARRRRAAADRRLLRHLRARQRRRRRAGAARGGAPRTRRRSLLAGAQRAGRWCTRRRLRAHAQPPLDAGRARARSARARPTWSRARRWPRSTACRCCCCRATSSPPASASPVLQELEDPASYDVSVNDCFRPVSRFWDRINRPEQLAVEPAGGDARADRPGGDRRRHAALPQDVQAEAFDWPEELFERRVWHVRRPVPEPEPLAEAAELLRGARRPLIVAGGGTIYAEATDALRALRRGDRHPGGRDAGRQGLAALRPPAARSARSARRAPPPPTRWPARPTWCSASARAGATSRPPRAAPSPTRTSRFVNLNVAPVDAYQARRRSPLVADARRGLEALGDALAGWRADDGAQRRARGGSPPSGTRPSRPRTRSATARCPPRAR